MKTQTESLSQNTPAVSTGSDYILRDYQVEAVNAGIKYLKDPHAKKPVIIIAPTGSGKSLIISSLAQQMDEPLIVFQPTKEILEQNYNKMMDYGIMGVTIYSASMNQKEIGNITLATIGSVYKKPEMFRQFKNIIMDECFPKGTLVDGVPIDKIKKGDVVRTYNHTTNSVEYKKVKATSKRKVKSNLIKINLSNGTSFVCTENHPIYTLEYGYISAHSLSLCVQKPLLLNIPFDEPQKDMALQNMWERVPSTKPRQNQYLLQQRVCSTGHRQQANKNKSKLLLLWKRIYFSGASTKKCTKNRALLLLERVQQCLQSTTLKRSYCGKTPLKRTKGAVINQNENQEPNVARGQQRENDRKDERENILVSWRKWRANKTTDCSSKCNISTNRICDRNSQSKGLIPEFASLLQSRPSRTFSEVSNRSGWADTQVEEVEVSGQEKNSSPQLIRLDSCEILERRDRQKFKSVCGDGYVYNFEVEDNHNYFVNNILVHNCHLANPRTGMYKTFFETVGEKIIGLTATPYRLSHDGFGGSILKFLTRTRPRVFTKVIHVTQTRDLAERGYFCKVKYYRLPGFNRSEILLNSTGADYLETSEKEYYTKHEFNQSVLDVIRRLLKVGKKRILVFTKFIEEAQTLSDELGDNAAIVSSLMKSKERDSVIKDFRSGKIKVVANVGVLTLGFNYPELECVVLARPTRSLTLYAQMTGRVVRPHPDKEEAWVVDMCGNYDIFGKMEDMDVVEYGEGLWFIESRGKRLTNVYLQDIMKD